MTTKFGLKEIRMMEDEELEEALVAVRVEIRAITNYLDSPGGSLISPMQLKDEATHWAEVEENILAERASRRQP